MARQAYNQEGTVKDLVQPKRYVAVYDYQGDPTVLGVFTDEGLARYYVGQLDEHGRRWTTIYHVPLNPYEPKDLPYKAQGVGNHTCGFCAIDNGPCVCSPGNPDGN